MNMFDKPVSRSHAGKAALLTALGLVAGSVIASGGTEAGSGGVSCEVRIEGSRNAPRLVGVVHAGTPVDGSYTLRVKGSGGGGSSDITQSGEFHAAPGAPATLGVVTLGGGSFDASLRVTWPGGSTSCRERTGGAI
jgi:hypothetical protein